MAGKNEKKKIIVKRAKIKSKVGRHFRGRECLKHIIAYIILKKFFFNFSPTFIQAVKSRSKLSGVEVSIIGGDSIK